MIGLRDLLKPHRIVLILLFLAFVVWCALSLRWDWLPKYAPLALEGLWRTIWLLVVTTLRSAAIKRFIMILCKRIKAISA